MPTYDYICDKCGHEFEVSQSIAAKPLATCTKETCGKKRWGKGKVRRAISGGGGLLFKGSGFYITDYRSENYKQGAKKDTAPSSPSPQPAPPGEGAAGGRRAESGERRGGPERPGKAESKPAAPAKPGGKKAAD